MRAVVVAITLLAHLTAWAEPPRPRGSLDIQLGGADGAGHEGFPGYIPGGPRLRLGATGGFRFELRDGLELGGALRIGFDLAGAGQLDTAALVDGRVPLRPRLALEISVGPLLSCHRRELVDGGEGTNCRGWLVDPAFTSVIALWRGQVAAILESEVIAYDLGRAARPLGTYVSVSAGIATRGRPAAWTLAADAVMILAFAVYRVDWFSSF